MTGRRLQALCLVLVLMSTIAAPACSTDDPKQPSVDNPHMHFWGTSQMDQCWTHFDEKALMVHPKMDMERKNFREWNPSRCRLYCRIQSVKRSRKYVSDANSSIVIELNFRFNTQIVRTLRNVRPNLTLFKGTTPVAMESFPQIGGSDAMRTFAGKFQLQKHDILE